MSTCLCRVVATAALACCSLVHAQCTEKAWSRQFGWSGINPEGDIHCFEVYDDGNGPRLYAGGSFVMIDGSITACGLAVWKDDHWAPVGDGRGMLWDAANQSSPGRVFDMTVWDPDGAGPERPRLVVVGDIYRVGPGAATMAPTIATWDGTQWATLGDGIPYGDFDVWGTGWPAGSAAQVYQGELYVAGAVSLTGFQPDEFGVVKWTGSEWIAVGHAKFKYGWPTSMAVYDDGTGEKLYVGGNFGQIWTWDPDNYQHTPIPGTSKLVAWNGTTWQGKSGIAPFVQGINNLNVIDLDGPGPGLASLFVGESNSMTTGGRTWRVTGNTASLVPGIESDPPAVFDDGSGPALYAFSSDYKLKRWNGTGAAVEASPLRMTTPNGYWPCCEPRGGVIKASIVWDFGQGPRLVLGGYLSGVTQPTWPFERVLSAYGLLTWDGSSFGSPAAANCPVLFISDTTMTEQMGYLTDGAVFDEDGAGPMPAALYATGHFNAIGGREALSFAKWNGDAWTPVGTGLTPDPADDFARPPIVMNPTVFDGQTGQQLAAISRSPGYFSVLGIYGYAAGTWTQLGAEFAAKDLAAFSNGGPSDLYATGTFNTIDGIVVNNITRFDSEANRWVPVGTGDGLQNLANPSLVEGKFLAVHDDGTGRQLYVLGRFDRVDGAPITALARWNGSAWSSVGAMPGAASAQFVSMVAIESGPAAGLYIEHAAATSGFKLWRWSGSSWSGIASPASGAVNLIGTEGGAAGVLYAVDAQNQFTNALRTFDGTTWATVAADPLWGKPSSMLTFSDTQGEGLYFFGNPYAYGIQGVSPVLLAEDGPFSLPSLDAISSPGIARLGCSSACSAPAVTLDPFAVTLCAGAGQAAEFSIAGSGSGPLLWQWRKDGSPIDVLVNPTAATQTLVIAPVTPDDSGLYDCVVSNACGEVTSAAALLTMCIGDFNCDGGIDGADIEAFFVMWESGDSAGDVNSDGGVDGGDIEYFFSRWEGGC